jgi:outer membrane immunogenic protein
MYICWLFPMGSVMKKFPIGIAAVVLLVATKAFAADMALKAPPLPVAAPFSWTGFYVGGSAGAAWARDPVTLSVANNPRTSGPVPFLYAAGDIPNLQALGSNTFSQTIGIFGGKAGYNYQWRYVVAGLEADFSAFHVSQSITSASTSSPFAGFPGGSASFNNSISTNWLATIRGRLGVTADRALFYATGGAAFAAVRFADSYTAFSPLGAGFDTGNASTNPTRAGWVAGGGIDYAFTNNWIASVEYLFVDLGSFQTTGLVTTQFNPGITALFTFNNRLQSNIVRGGVSYKFY